MKKRDHGRAAIPHDIDRFVSIGWRLVRLDEKQLIGPRCLIVKILSLAIAASMAHGFDDLGQQADVFFIVVARMCFDAENLTEHLPREGAAGSGV